MINRISLAVTLVCASSAGGLAQEAADRLNAALPYCVVDTGQTRVFSDKGQLLKDPQAGEPFFGQDGQYGSHPFRYRVSRDGLTVYDENTGLTWQRSPRVGSGAPSHSDKLTLKQADALPARLNAAKFGGFRDWRLPSIKELYSLINFSGVDPAPDATSSGNLTPFIDTKYFKFVYGDAGAGERIIDSQWATSTRYVANRNQMFGVNFADGRIKGYGATMPGRGDKTFFVICVRGNERYGVNDFHDNGDKTVSDRATGLMWAKDDSAQGMNWQEALAWAQARNGANYLGHGDWRLPSAKELQSIVDYRRSPDTSHSAAIDPLFHCTRITNEAGQADYPCYWTATTHNTASGRAAVYVAFGRGLGYMRGAWRDVHGAGAQRSDPKAGDPSAFPQGRGPQGDAIRINNYVRLVRTIDSSAVRLVQADVRPLPLARPQGGFAGGPLGGAGRGPEGRGGAAGPRQSYHLLPRFVAEQLQFTPEQAEQLAALERETKSALDKILTPQQRKALEDFRPRDGAGPEPP